MTPRALKIGFTLGLLTIPVSAFADYSALNSVVNAVGGMMPNLSNYTGSALCDAVNGPCGFAAIAGALVLRFRPLLTIVGIMGMSIAGIRMIVKPEDDSLTKARTVISACIAGIVLANLTEPFLAAFYGQSGSVEKGGMAEGVAVLSIEVSGLINWVLTIAAVLAVLMIIYSAFRALKYANVTTEEGINGIRKTVLYTISGILILTVRIALADAIANHPQNPAALLVIAVVLASYALGFFALAAVCVIVYAGVQLVLSMGNEEAMTKAKSILIRAIIGTILLVLSLAIVRFVIEPGLS